MVSTIQTNVADLLIWMGPWGNKLWKLTGFIFMSALAFIAIKNYFLMQQEAANSFAASVKKQSTDKLFYITLVVTILLLRLPGISRLETNPDEGGLIAGALTLLVDPRFWISVDNTTLGPLSTFSLTVIPVFGGTINFGTIKLLAIIICILSVLLLYMSFVNLYGKIISKIIILPVAACVATFTYWDYISFNGEHVPVLLISLGVYLLSRVLIDQEQKCSAFLLGIILGLVPYAKVQAAPIALVFGVAVFTLLIIEKDKRYFTLMAGALIPTILIFGYLFASGAFPDFWQSYILNNLKYASEGFFSQTKNITFLQKVSSIPEYLTAIPDTRIFFITQLFVALLGLAFIFRKWRSVSTLDKKLTVISVSVLMTALYCVILPGNNWTHYLLLLIVPVVLFFGVVVGTCNKIYAITISANSMRNSLIAGSFIVATAIVPAIYVLMQHNIAFREAKMNSEDGKDISESSKKILEYAKPGDRMAVWGFFLKNYVETGLIQGTREAHTERQLDKSTQQKYYVDRWLADIKKNKPPVFVQSLDSRWTQYRIDNFPAVKDYIDKNYQLVSTSNVIYNFHNWTHEIYISNDRLARMHDKDMK